jgi:signal transduction histidine kinase
MISKSLFWKMVLAFLLVAITTAGLVALFIRMTSADRLASLILDQQRAGLKSSLANYYAAQNSWSGIAQNWGEIRSHTAATVFPASPDRPANTDRGGGPGTDRRRFFGLIDAQGTVLVQIDSNFPEGSTMPPETMRTAEAVQSNGKTVGYIISRPFPLLFNPEEALFLRRTTEALLFAVIGAMLVAFIIGAILARTLIRPVRSLTQAADAMASGHLGQQVQVKSKDEIGQLANAFNAMSQQVARSNQLRQQMTADIAHDLRTPLTVIGGYVESMRDGVLQATPERLSLIYTEIERLQNLVGDLKMLSQADAGELALHKQWLDPQALLVRAAAPFQHRAEKQNIQLTVDAPTDLPEIHVDEARMMQVFSNLLTNAMRYTPEGGTIQLAAKTIDGKVELQVVDNGTGIQAEDMPYIFDRFYRADKSRTTDGGESGLGLAIVKALVEVQGGTVRAQSTQGQGTTILVDFPSN